MRTGIVLALAGVLSLSAAGCANNQESGTLVGAITGAIVGNQVGQGTGRVLATAAGAVVGGIVGSEIGRKLDEADRRRAAEAEYYALEEEEVGSSRDWRSPESGHRGEIVITDEYREAGQLCRDYEHTIYIDGEPDVLTGTSCRGDDGRWRSIG